MVLMEGAHVFELDLFEFVLEICKIALQSCLLGLHLCFGILHQKTYSLTSFRKLTPPENRQHMVSISKLKQEVDDFVGESTF